MSGHRNIAIEDTVLFPFAVNDTSGSDIDGSSPSFDVRLQGAAASAVPVLEGTPTLLTAAGYADGSYEVEIEATVSNGFAVNEVYSVYATLTADSQTPNGVIGTFDTFGRSATTAQVESIGSSSSGARAFEIVEDNASSPIKGVSSVGTQTGTFANTEADDGVLHTIDDVTNDIDWIYGADVTDSRIATEFTFKGYLDSSNDSMLIQAYNFVDTTWETRAVLTGKNGTANETITAALLTKHTGTGADLGKVYIRFDADGVMTSPQLNVDELFVSAVLESSSLGYDGGYVYVDTNATGSDETGTIDQPATSIADGKTIAIAKNLRKISIAPGSSDTLGSSFDNYEINGSGYVLGLGGQSISNAVIIGGNISGTGTGANEAIFRLCDFGDVTLPISVLNGCSLSGDITLGSAGGYFFYACSSGFAANASEPILDFSTAGNCTVIMTDYSGSVLVNGMGDSGVDLLSLTGDGNFIEGTCTGGIVPIAGNFTTANITNLTIADGARYSTQQIQDLLDGLNDVSVGQIMAGGDADGFSLEEALKILLSSGAGVLSGAATSAIVIEAVDGSRTRISATVDEFGNRTAVVLDANG